MGQRQLSHQQWLRRLQWRVSLKADVNRIFLPHSAKNTNWCGLPVFAKCICRNEPRNAIRTVGAVLTDHGACAPLNRRDSDPACKVKGRCLEIHYHQARTIYLQSCSKSSIRLWNGLRSNEAVKSILTHYVATIYSPFQTSPRPVKVIKAWRGKGDSTPLHFVLQKVITSDCNRDSTLTVRLKSYDVQPHARLACDFVFR
jgi:hypothetical protein